MPALKLQLSVTMPTDSVVFFGSVLHIQLDCDRMLLRDQPPLIQSLLDPSLYSHPARDIALRETHISWILLTGKVAYKIKKPVDLGFVDFTTIERRKHFCEEELRLNGRYSDDLYLGVVPITGTPQAPQLNGPGEAFEYAVQMRQFDEHDLLLNRLAAGMLTQAMLKELATVVHRAHVSADAAPAECDWGTPDAIWQPAIDNFHELHRLVTSDALQRQLRELQRWTERSFESLNETFSTRRAQGHVRECHGDLHLGNIVVWQGMVTPFDCIEFNPGFRWIDTMNEIAFLVMDLDDHGRSDLAACFLNAVLEESGDYAGIVVLPFYLVYRALVRAKVELLRQQQTDDSVASAGNTDGAGGKYIELATRYTKQNDKRLIITYGVSGSGKTSGTQALLERWGAIRIRSDVERKRFFRISPTDRAPAVLYSENMTFMTYEVMAMKAREIIRAGFPAIVDATFLKQEQRARFRQLATELGASFEILSFDAPEEELKRRIAQREESGGDASDADVSILEEQLKSREPLTQAEQQFNSNAADLLR